MALNNIFKSMKKEGYITAPLDVWLFQNSNSRDNDRALDVNAPSAAGGCLRENYYRRKGYTSDGVIKPRSQRILDNGTHVHLRLQEYLKEMGLLIMDEVPVVNGTYNIQGHTDGYLNLGDEIAILEIKSINDSGFKSLKQAKEEHKKQGLIYLFCAEERRKVLKDYYKTAEDFNNSIEDRKRAFESYYNYLEDGHKYSREQKIAYEVGLNLLSDNVLYYTEKPVTKIIYLYENKNDQDLKEFVISSKETENDVILTDMLKRYKKLNECCEKDIMPDREGTKSSSLCRWCNYHNECWVV